ncbi:helix-turn-helix transcriptional regulator [Luteolibacter sp. SL250]|uniref:helix-turn-helix transcriptional regulator n=1 Tax=Luteolibacter sp. SL250 TaxID=2995170 RepID=UPI002270A9C4|nr:helix-turn-helix transcriptional regulator [Luteolibacter sp. SL250]WAC20467.1 helix-turn-helix transcriptional regulator [Luteolibacter sp. SL250]
MEDSVEEKDARAMVRLVAEVAALRGDHTTSKRYLMDGLRRMVGADSWVWALGYLDPSRPPVYAAYLHEGFDEARFARYLQAVEHPGMKVLMEPFTRELMERKSHITRTRQQIDRPGASASAAVANEFWLAADIAPIILSARPLNEGCVSIIALYRRADQPMFSERERKIAHILLTEAFWLHAEGWPEDFGAKTPELSRPRRLVLNLLLEGRSRKMIADQLNLSIHTVSDYVKDIYSNFNVQSHAELMRRFTRGAGGGTD